MIEVGFSLYLGSGYDHNQLIIEKAVKAQMKYAFTSLHIIEEELAFEREVNKLINCATKHNLNLIVDISPNTLTKLGYHDYH
ncbi:MAG: MupG family TIM beta-alpha barrel fold protein, partial [Bacilli bacterium]